MSYTSPMAALTGERTPYRYVLLDVFTDTPFAGNPLAVFTDAGDLDDESMACIASELNLSETVFITDRQQKDSVTMRIFTPRGEIPFAGHPTVGTAWLIRALGWHDGESPLILRELVGDVPIHFEGPRVYLKTAQPLAISERSLSSQQAAELLGLPVNAVAKSPVKASCGVFYHLIELRDIESLGQADVNITRLKSALPDPAERDLYVYVRQPENRLRARMFAPGVGISEDPATGSAAAPLIGYLSSLDIHEANLDEALAWEVMQGVEMGRPSRIHGHVEQDGHSVTAIHIAGEAVMIGDGTLYR